MAPKELSARDRDFLNKVQKAIFTNPFSEERMAIDQGIIGDDAGTDLRKREEHLAHKVGKGLDAIGRLVGPLRNYAGIDRTLLDYAILFSTYHSYCPAFDTLIADQVKAGNDSCPVPFATSCLGGMVAQGIEISKAERYFALFFQMRRAFYFITQIVGTSNCMKELRHSLWNNVFTYDISLYEHYLWNRMEDFSTLILGETGTGKGMAAKAIGRSGYIPFDSRKNAFSESFTKAFVPINLSQFPEQLLDSELFGHKKGSFTGAIANHQGVFEHCSPHGSIFLDEIGEVSIPVQIKLLKVLEERVFTPVGSHQGKRFEGRVIAATNRSLAAILATGAFRDDFYYRLCSGTINVPPLRQRLLETPSELEVLVSHCVQRITGKPSPPLVKMVRASLKDMLPAAYHWPGNVRELEQATRSILLSRAYHGQPRPNMGASQSQLAAIVDEGRMDAQSLLAHYCALLYERHGTYGEVARITGLDRRTVKKHITKASA